MFTVMLSAHIRTWTSLMTLGLVPYYNISLLAQFPMTLILIASFFSASSSLSLFLYSQYPHVLSGMTSVHRAYGYMLL